MAKRSQWSVASGVLEGDVDARRRLQDVEAQLSVYRALDSADTVVIPAVASARGNATAVALLSDVHCEERVETRDVPGVNNAYDPDICAKRMEQYWQKVVLMTEAQRHLASIDTLVLALLGDIITGYLHDDNRESNFMSPTKATLFAEELICGGLEFLLSKGGFDSIVIPCTPGNHGRTTQKPRAKTAIDNSFEWMMYQHLAKRWAHEPRLKWHIAGGAHVYLNVAGRVCRFHHGDDIHYGGGIGGLSIPLNKAIAQWNRVCHADLDFLGHWHQLRDFGHAVVNGSVIGYNAYALKSKCDFEPPKQAYILMDHERGKSLVAEIWTDWMPS